MYNNNSHERIFVSTGFDLIASKLILNFTYLVTTRLAISFIDNKIALQYASVHNLIS